MIRNRESTLRYAGDPEDRGRFGNLTSDTRPQGPHPPFLLSSHLRFGYIWTAVACYKRTLFLKHRKRAGAFTLLELLVVIGIISILLIAVIPAVTSMSKSSGRKGAISNLLGAIEQARAEAIKIGQSTYLVFPTFATDSPTTERYNYKSYAIFVDDPEHPDTRKQLTNWKTFSTGVSIRPQISAWPAETFIFTPLGHAVQSFPYLKFNSNGEVESPPETGVTGPVTLAVFEGRVNGTAEIKTTRTLVTESINIARLTGRAERAP